MVRGTTAYFKFIMPYNYSQLSSAKVVFWQNHNNGPSISRPLPIIKTLPQCAPTLKANELSVFLTPEETLRFSDERKAYVQLTAASVGGIRFASGQEMITVYPSVDDSVDDVGGVIPTPGIEDLVIFDGGHILQGIR